MSGILGAFQSFRSSVAVENTAAWFGGGYTPNFSLSTVDRITYATDTATATTRGPLSLARVFLAAAGGIQ